MGQEFTKVELYGANNDGTPVRYTVADGASISKGTLLQLTDPRTASRGDGAERQWAGVASMDKLANDGSTSISCWTNGVFDATASGTITTGDAVAGAAGAVVSAIKRAITGASGANIIGYALETATDGEIINFKLDL